MTKPNTPAGEYWTLYIAYSSYMGLHPETRMAIAFLPTGEIDRTHTNNDTLTRANALLAPTVQILSEILGESTFDIWKFFNWVIVTEYWGFLADLGQMAPTAYDLTIPKSPQPVTFPSTNNIFINETLFEIYSGYFNNTLLPFVGKLLNMSQYPPVLLNSANRLTRTETTLLRSYTCTTRQLKYWLNLVIAVISADYVLIVGAYSIVSFIAGRLQKRKDERKF